VVGTCSSRRAPTTFAPDVILDVASQQDAPPGNLAEEDDRDVVDPASRIGRLARNAARVRPEHAEADVVEADPGARRERGVWRRGATGEIASKRRVARARPAHAGLVDPPDPIALEQERQAGDMILVRMGQDQDVDPAVPGRQATIELDQEAIRVRSAIDQHPRATTALDEDRIALSDVENRDPRRAVGPMGDDETERAHGNGKTDDRQPGEPRRRGARSAVGE